MARVEIKTNAQLQQMARAGAITSRALDAAVAAARPGRNHRRGERCF